MEPRIHFIKPTFAGGEYAPSMYSRVDVARYTSGVKKLLNFIVHPHGGASNRPGWHFAAKAKYPSRKCRVHDFQFSSTQTYALELGHYYVRFFTNNGQISVSSATGWLTSTSYNVGDYVTQSSVIYYCIVAHTSGTFATDLANGDWVAQTIYEVPTPYSETDLPSLNFTQSADVLFIFHPLYQTRQLNRLGSTNWTVTKYAFTFGPCQIPNSDTTLTITPSGTSGSGITLTASSALFNALQVGGLFQINHSLAEQSVSSSLGSVAAGSSIICGGTWRIITHGTWAATIAVQKSTDGGSNWTNIRTFSSASDFNANTFGTEDMSNNAPAFKVRLNMSAYTSGTCSYTLTADAFRNVGYIQITGYSSATVITGTVTKLLGATTATSDWAEGSWSDYRGWPAVGEFNQDRLITGNTANEPQTIWQTKASNYYDYSRSQPLVDSDGITTNIPARQLNGVNGFIPLTSLIALTSSSEWGIGAPDVPMSPLTITQKPYGFDGSNGLKPVIIKNRAVYVQFMGAVVLDLGFELISNSFTGANLSLLANHLFDGYSIIDMCYQQYPDSIIWMVRNDGILLSLTYLREQEVIAWAHHETEGLVESVCSLPSSGYNQVWLSVLRGDTRFIEYMDHRMASTLPEDQFFVDCGISYDGTVPDSYSKLWLKFEQANHSQTFIDSNTSPKTITAVNGVEQSTDQFKFGNSSGKFNGDAGNDSYTVLLLHLDGADASTTFTDSSSGAKTVTRGGTAIVSTSKSKFGGACAYFNSGFDSNTKLMLHMDGSDSGTTFTDSSAGAKTVTRVSTPVTKTGTKQFGTASMFSGASTKYLTLADSADWAFGSGAFTIDFWLNDTDPNIAAPGSGFNAAGVFEQGNDVNNRASLLIRYDTGATAIPRTIEFNIASGGVSALDISGPLTLMNGTWHHIAVIRGWGGNVNSWVLCVDGVPGTPVIYSGAYPDYTGTFAIGAAPLGGGGVSQSINYIDEFRIVKGVAAWTSTFRPALTAYGSGDYLSLADAADWNFGTGDFTIDCWVNLDSLNGSRSVCGQGSSGSTFAWINFDGTNFSFTSFVGSSALVSLTTVSTISIATWYHIAIVRHGNVFTLYLNGSVEASGTASITYPDYTGEFAVGAHTEGAGTFFYYFDGFIDEFRVTKGYARWLGAFTPPMSAYAAPGYLTTADSADFNFASGDFTVHCWVNLSSLVSNQTVWSQGTDSTHYATLQFDGTHWVFSSPNGAAVTLTSTSAVTTGTWTHLAVIRYGNIWKLYINGIAEATVTSSGTYSDYTGVFTLGCLYNGSANQFLIGYVDEFHVDKGVARWTATFTPPTVSGFYIPTNVLTGLDHLNGYLVSILADGVVSPQQTVANGSITLPAPATKVHIGLPYTSDLETLNIEVALPDGTMQGRKVRVSKATIRLLNSKGGYIGPDENTLTKFKSVFDAYQESSALFTGDLKHTLGGGYADGGRMFIRQTDPLPLTVLALMPIVSVAGMTMEK